MTVQKLQVKEGTRLYGVWKLIRHVWVYGGPFTFVRGFQAGKGEERGHRKQANGVDRDSLVKDARVDDPRRPGRAGLDDMDIVQEEIESLDSLQVWAVLRPPVYSFFPARRVKRFR